MSLSTFIKLVGKAFRFTVNRPIQRFNVYNRAKKYLGPDAKYFKPAPRAIGPMSQNTKPLQYPHLTGGSRPSEKIDSGQLRSLPKPSFSETEEDDSVVTENTPKLDVKKTTTVVNNNENALTSEGAQKRSLPTLTNLDRRDPADIWITDKVPPGRLSLNMFQEMMLNKIGEGDALTPKIIAERYKIREEYAESLVKYLKQIRIVVSPRMAMYIDYVGRTNEEYQATKHLIYYVDKSLRDKNDKLYDKMYLPSDEIDPKIRELLDRDDEIAPVQQFNEVARVQRLVKRPEPLRVGPINKPQQESGQKLEVPERRRLASARRRPDSDNVT